MRDSGVDDAATIDAGMDATTFPPGLDLDGPMTVVVEGYLMGPTGEQVDWTGTYSSPDFPSGECGPDLSFAACVDPTSCGFDVRKVTFGSIPALGPGTYDETADFVMSFAENSTALQYAVGAAAPGQTPPGDIDFEVVNQDLQGTGRFQAFGHIRMLRTLIPMVDFEADLRIWIAGKCR